MSDDYYYSGQYAEEQAEAEAQARGTTHRQEPRRLLELAAKAAEVEIDTWSNCQPGGFVKGGSGVFWNPLTDDGDALRLAVDLRLRLVVTDYGCGASRGEIHWLAALDEVNSVPEATRLAIVRAAAAVGEQMENDDAEDD